LDLGGGGKNLKQPEKARPGDNLQGKLVRTLVNGPIGVGYHSAVFDAKDDAGKAVASGAYLCRMQAEGFTKTIKLVLSR
jgi:hypothetical protein